MTDDNPEPWVAATMKMFAYLSKPPMKPSLLRRPPVKYIHDLIKEVLVEKKWPQGVLTEEDLDGNNIKVWFHLFVGEQDET